MSMMNCRLVLLCLVTVFGSATFLHVPNARAECAWILWSYNLRYDKPDAAASDYFWLVEEAFPTYEACARALKVITQTGFEFGRKRAIRTELGNGKSTMALYECRPDTLDPRK